MPGIIIGFPRVCAALSVNTVLAEDVLKNTRNFAGLFSLFVFSSIAPLEREENSAFPFQEGPKDGQ